MWQSRELLCSAVALGFLKVLEFVEGALGNGAVFPNESMEGIIFNALHYVSHLAGSWPSSIGPRLPKCTRRKHRLTSGRVI